MRNTEGLIIAAFLTRVVDGYAITSILNTNDTEVNVQEPLVGLDEVDLTRERDSCTEFESQDRKKDIQTQLMLEHLLRRVSRNFWHSCGP